MAGSAASDEEAPLPADFLPPPPSKRSKHGEDPATEWHAEAAMSNAAVLHWVKARYEQAEAAYGATGPLPSPKGGFPQWETLQHCEKGEKQLLRALGRVRRPAQGEEGYVAVVEVAFRGTENIENWISNLNVLLTPMPTDEKAGEVHAGFAECYTSLQEDLLQQIQRCLALEGVSELSPSVLVLATGHSLGGALAQLLAYDLACKGCTTCCVSFGAPKVGDGEWAGSYNKRVGRTLRFVNKFDPVPRLPPGDSEPIVNDADAMHMGIAKLLKRSPMANTVDPSRYVHTCPATQLDDGLMSSMQHWTQVVSASASILGRKRGTEASMGATEPTEEEEEEKHNAVVPHGTRVYQKNLVMALGRARNHQQSLATPAVKGIVAGGMLAAGLAAAAVAFKEQPVPRSATSDLSASDEKMEAKATALSAGRRATCPDPAAAVAAPPGGGGGGWLAGFAKAALVVGSKVLEESERQAQQQQQGQEQKK